MFTFIWQLFNLFLTNEYSPQILVLHTWSNFWLVLKLPVAFQVEMWEKLEAAEK